MIRRMTHRAPSLPRTLGFVSDPLEAFRQKLGQSVRHLVAGDPGDSAELVADPDGDVGLFGPDSAVWIVHSDAAMLIGGVRALLFQTLHPLAMAGVAEHSDYEADPLGRLHRTAQFMGVTTFGSTAQAEQAVQMVSSIHDRVRGVSPDGHPYSANDPRLLAWVHATEVDSFLSAFRRYGRKNISDAQADQYVAEMATIGEMLGMTSAPRSVDELQAELDGFRGELATTKQSREALRFITFAPLPMAVRGPYGVLYGAAAGLLPKWARRMLRIPRLPIAERLAVQPVASALTTTLSWALGPSPSRTAAEKRAKEA